MKLAKDTLTCFSAKLSIFHMAQATTAILMSMCTNHTHGHQIAVMACAIWKMEGLAEKQVRVSLASFMTVPMAELKHLLSNIIVRWMSTIYSILKRNILCSLAYPSHKNA